MSALHEPITFLGIPWLRYHGALVPDVAPHVPVALSSREAGDLLRLSGARVLRWHTEFDTGRPWAFWHVIKDGPADLGDLVPGLPWTSDDEDTDA